MDSKSTVEPAKTAGSDVARLSDQYSCGPVRLAGTQDGLYERHLLFDNVVDLEAIDARQSFEAFAHSVAYVLSQRWVRTEKTYTRENPSGCITSRWNS